MRHLVIGMGQVGQALREVLEAEYEVTGIDKETQAHGVFDVLHICYPYNKDFYVDTWEYIFRYIAGGALVIIHSSVPVGTCKQFRAVHSPIRGVHPHLAKGIRTFVKFFGGELAQASRAALVFAKLGVPTHVVEDARNTEAMKLWDTTYYGWNIVFEKAVHEFCVKHGLNFDVVYTKANETYNSGYKKLGLGHVQRPVLEHRSGPIGGHCVIPNALLLGDEPVAKSIVYENVRLQNWQKDHDACAAAPRKAA